MAALDQNLHYALRRAPQCERVARAGRDHPDREAAAQCIELVGERNKLAGARAGDRVFHAYGFVLIVDGERDFFRLALRPRVESSDDALQLGELLHQFGGQVALGKLRRADG